MTLIGRKITAVEAPLGIRQNKTHHVVYTVYIAVTVYSNPFMGVHT